MRSEANAVTLLLLLTLSACSVNIEEEIRTSPEGVATQSYISSALQGKELSPHYGECATERDRAEGHVFWKEFEGLAESLKDVQFVASSGNSKSSSLNLMFTGGETERKAVVDVALEGERWRICRISTGHLLIDDM
ncbi:hypothetical protein [Streptomyces djakartensis]|uniref:hypothetical protein n=1 Tax=Streptomyces djakartensis TaxID=68193 RepID=UPI0034E03106